MTATDRDYRYRLDPTSRKYRCPSCGRRTLVAYLDPSGTPLSDLTGRCDRQDKCRYHYTPRQYFADHPLTAPAHMRLRRLRHSSRLAPLPYPEKRPISVIDPRMVTSSLARYDINPLVRWLHATLDPAFGPATVSHTIARYGVGTSRLWGGATVFWLTDRAGRVRTGKIMGYDPLTGRRLKQPRPLMAWAHKLAASRRTDFTLRQCFFGSHLTLPTPASADPVIWLMESEKAALITDMALHHAGVGGLFVPVAAGGCAGLNPTPEALADAADKHALLRGRRVALFPDRGK